MDGLWNDVVLAYHETVEAVWTADQTKTVLWRTQEDNTTFVAEVQDDPSLDSRKWRGRRRRRILLGSTLCVALVALIVGVSMSVSSSSGNSSAASSSQAETASSPEVSLPDVFVNEEQESDETSSSTTNTAPLPTTLAPTELPSLEPTQYVTKITTFYAIGDVPYSDEEHDDLRGQMRNIPSDADFVIHVGDIRSAEDGNDCHVDDYRSVAATLRLSHAPVFLVLGDNEWNDCPNISEGWEMWQGIFGGFDGRHWNHDINVGRQPGREENFYFVLNDTLFVGLNLVGGDVHDSDEWEERLYDQFHWFKFLVREYDNDMNGRVGRVVLFGHADPKDEHEDFFKPLRDFIRKGLRNRIPILYVNGDKHEWLVEEEYLGQESFLRIMLTGGSVDPPLQVKVYATGEAVDDISEAFDYNRGK